MRRTGITRSVAAVVMGSLTLVACGGSSDSGSGPSATATPPAATTPAPTEPQTTTEGQPEPEPAPEPETTSEPGDEPAVDEPAAVDDEPAAEPDAAPAAVWPDDGCSADNSPTPSAVAEGPAPAIELRPESVDGPLPDLAVRRLNCKGGWENLRNELPADRPLLVWFWAPH